MTTTAIAPTDVDEAVFDASAYDLPIPKMDGRKATNLDIRFSGSGSLDRTSEDDLALYEAMRLGNPVRLIVTGVVGGKGFRLSGVEGEELSVSCTVRVDSVEAAELA
jgi:hypothetical protein